mmetsp:Transcript_33265/g.78384  ORF Transcript_33265/g.78384 Transcript_33265/m.78384 type:complete len:128 (+) Transcript_33265:103-486(+)
MFGLEKVVPSVVGSFKGEKPQPFGHGDPEAEEQNCKDFQVFMECRGYYNQDRTKKVLKAGSTVADAKKAFGREMVQEKVLDEKGYELDPDSKLSVHSNKCRLNLTFAYSQSVDAHVERLTNKLSSQK